MKLSPGQLKEFDEQGYLFFPNCFSEEEIALLRDDAEAILAELRQFAEAGVDWISVGALTHSAPVLDIGLDADVLRRRGGLRVLGGGRPQRAGQRDRVFLVSKVEANQVSGDGIARACAARSYGNKRT